MPLAQRKPPLRGLTASSSHGWHTPCFSRNSRDFITVLAGAWKHIWLLLLFLLFLGGDLFLLDDKKTKFPASGCFLCPAGGQPWRGSSVGQGGQRRCHHGKKATLAVLGCFRDALKSWQNPPAPGCRTEPPERPWKVKEEQWGALGRLLASRLSYFLWVWDKKKEEVGRIAKFLARIGRDATPGMLGTYSSICLGTWE